MPPAARTCSGVEFTKESQTAAEATVGTATLYINDKEVGELKDVETQLGKFACAARA